VEWSAVEWSGVRWSEVEWGRVRWSEVEWEGVKGNEVEWGGVKWSGVKWSKVEWSGVKWSEVKWSEVKWSEVEWSGVEWSGVEWVVVVVFIFNITNKHIITLCKRKSTIMKVCWRLPDGLDPTSWLPCLLTWIILILMKIKQTITCCTSAPIRQKVLGHFWVNNRQYCYYLNKDYSR
jgi:hypothetical protein